MESFVTLGVVFVFAGIFIWLASLAVGWGIAAIGLPATVVVAVLMLK